MKKSTLIGIVYLFFFNSFAQAPEIDWQRTIGGNQNEYPTKIKQTSDNGYIIGGSSSSGISGNKSQPTIGTVDYWVVKLNADASIEWEKTISGNLADSFSTLVETNDGGFLIGGSSSSDNFYDKSQNSQGNLDYWIVKLDANGTILWDKTFGGSANDMLIDIQTTEDNGFIIAGYSSSSISGDKTENSRGTDDYWVLKINSSGEILWQKTIGGNNADLLRSVKQLNDGNFILAGLSFSDISGDRTIDKIFLNDAWIVKLSSTGDLLWQENYNIEDVSTIIQTTDGNLIIAGSQPYSSIELKTNQSFSFNSIIFKINPAGEVLWTHYDQPVYGDCAATAVVETADGYYYSSNCETTALNESVVTKLNLNGNLIWRKNFASQAHEFMNTLDKTNDNSVICAIRSASPIYGDKTENTQGLNDYWIVKLLPSSLSVEENNRNPFLVYPNPFQDSFTILSNANENYSISIYNTLGQEILKQNCSNELEHKVEFDFQSGIYFLKIQTNTTKTFVLKKL